MEVRSYTDPDAFWAIAGPVADAEPVLHSVLASVTDSVRRDPEAYPSRAFYAVLRAGLPPFLALHTPPYPFHLPAGDPEAASALADFVHAGSAAPGGVGGALDSAVAFADRWCALTGRTQRVAMRLGLYDLPGAPRLQRPVPGTARQATLPDEPLVAEWLTAFRAELDLGEPGAAGSRLAVEDGRVLFWCDPEPVAMALVSVPSGGVARVGYVYTPPGHRGRGYASAVTARISEEQRARGLHCMLYTDLANPTSNGIYAAIGYRRLGETVELAFCG